MKNKFILFAAISGFFCIAFGAFASHGLAKTLDVKALSWIDTGIQYQMFHTLALLALGLFQLVNSAQNPPACRAKALNIIGGSWTLGILLFSGSLYALALFGQRLFVWSTPLGGVFFMIGWAALIFVSLRAKKTA
ncbi:DUF423 domain-containing protein [Actinobacillus equuli subsp. equuli]|uniref:DUF423 domain-containing protein n=1 Tax=Actinobacillus equuli subsp. equuli TaxID=202947 RepID=A0A9X4G3R8_ACTEU|nr:DUF423 domain-containing protein [Actinobacillus equuli]MDE8034741.1 DUF423 domain-containing protein [Actinobacillus equuli subsp. equuli]MDG4948626.1 DUF423 domain-containing protein [Actinobacillus equuli subsp. haemolyticus]